MSTPYLGQLMLAAFNFAPKGFALSNGQLMAINQNQALFSLLGTTYGGNGTTTFALPNLQGRTPVSYGNGFTQGQAGGEEIHTLSQNEVPQHTHQLHGTSSAAGSSNPASNIFAAATAPVSPYAALAAQVQMNSASIGNYGGSQPHENRQPYVVMNWVIALTGIFPSRN
jgi:microcystin-dependent protein